MTFKEIERKTKISNYCIQQAIKKFKHDFINYFNECKSRTSDLNNEDAEL